MARKGGTSEFSFDTVQVGQAAALPKGVRDTEPNPLEQHVINAVDAGPQYLPVPNGDMAMQAQRYLRRAVQGKYGLSVRFTDANDQPLTPAAAEAAADQVYVYFEVRGERKEREYSPRQYNNADIREWANLGEGDKITKEIRNAFREERGLTVRNR